MSDRGIEVGNFDSVFIDIMANFIGLSVFLTALYTAAGEEAAVGERVMMTAANRTGP